MEGNTRQTTFVCLVIPILTLTSLPKQFSAVPDGLHRHKHLPSLSRENDFSSFSSSASLELADHEGVFTTHIPQYPFFLYLATLEHPHVKVICQSLSSFKATRETWAPRVPVTVHRLSVSKTCSLCTVWQLEALLNLYHALSSIFNAL